MTTELATVLIVGYFLICILVVNRKAKKEGVSFKQAYSLLLSDKFSDKDQKAKKDKKDSRMTPQRTAMSHDPRKRKEKQKEQSGKEAGFALISIAIIGCMAYYVGSSSSYSGSGSYTNGTNNGSSNTQYANGVTVNNVKEYFGYGSETVVVDCSDCETLSESSNKVLEALKHCPKRILMWDQSFDGYVQDYSYMYSCFWATNVTYSNTMVNGIPIGIIEPIYTVTDKDEIARMQGEIDAVAQEILEKCPGGLDSYGSCRVIHDELIKRVTYDHSLSLPHIYDIYGALVNGEAVCQGYAYAFSYLTSILGYDSVVVCSEDHAWNMMNSPIDCNDRFVDVTWDDKDYQDSHGNDYILYEYFGLSKEEVEAVDSHVIIGINGTQQAIIDDHQPFNYQCMNGYTCWYPKCSYDRVVEIFSMQDARNGNTASIKFLDDESWNWAKSELLSNDKRLLWDAFCEAIGYRTKLLCWVNDDLRVISIGIE